MKRMVVTLFSVALMTCALAMGQDSMKADTGSKAAKITGKISDDGRVFSADKDTKSWKITNPDAVKGHEGHHVTVTGRVDADKGEIHVTSMKMGKGKCPCGEGGSEGKECKPCP